MRPSSSSGACLRSVKSSLTIPRTPWRAAKKRSLCGAFRASRTAPTSDWLITDVGPPDWPMTALPRALLIRDPGAKITRLQRLGTTPGRRRYYGTAGGEFKRDLLRDGRRVRGLPFDV